MTAYLSLLLALFAVLPGAVSDCAGSGYVEIVALGSCYQRIATVLNFPSARNFCESQGAHLAIIDASGEAAALVTQIANSANWPNWVGAFRLVSGGAYFWVSSDDTQNLQVTVDQTVTGVTNRLCASMSSTGALASTRFFFLLKTNVKYCTIEEFELAKVNNL